MDEPVPVADFSGLKESQITEAPIIAHLGRNVTKDGEDTKAPVIPKEKGLITLSGLPTAHWKNLFHLESSLRKGTNLRKLLRNHHLLLSSCSGVAESLWRSQLQTNKKQRAGPIMKKTNGLHHGQMMETMNLKVPTAIRHLLSSQKEIEYRTTKLSTIREGRLSITDPTLPLY
jgi:hypothetical protein